MSSIDEEEVLKVSYLVIVILTFVIYFTRFLKVASSICKEFHAKYTESFWFSYLSKDLLPNDASKYTDILSRYHKKQYERASEVSF